MLSVGDVNSHVSIWQTFTGRSIIVDVYGLWDWVVFFLLNWIPTRVKLVHMSASGCRGVRIMGLSCSFFELDPTRVKLVHMSASGCRGVSDAYTKHEVCHQVAKKMCSSVGNEVVFFFEKPPQNEGVGNEVVKYVHGFYFLNHCYEIKINPKKYNKIK